MQRDSLFDRPAALFHGAHLARVVSLADPAHLNRVQVRLFAFDGSDHDAPLWARVVSAFAGSDRGAFFIPDAGDEVLVVFAGGDARFPLVVGGLWNGAAAAPAQVDGERNVTKCITSKNGIRVTFTDEDGQEQLTLETPGGQKLTLKDGPGTATLEDANGNKVTLAAAGITVQASAKVTVQASQVDVKAGIVKVDAAMSKFSGIVKCDVLMSNSVISSSYTPGAGNVW